MGNGYSTRAEGQRSISTWQTGALIGLQVANMLYQSFHFLSTGSTQTFYGQRSGLNTGRPSLRILLRCLLRWEGVQRNDSAGTRSG